MKIDWADEVANNHEHHLNVALWQTGISQRDFAAICNWAASIVLSRVEEGAKAIRRKKLIGRSTANGVFCVADTKTDKNGQYVLYDDVLSLLESDADKKEHQYGHGAAVLAVRDAIIEQSATRQGCRN